MGRDISRLPDAELDIMQALWSLGGPAKSKEIEEALSGIHPMAVTTMLTLLSRLESKGFVSVARNGRTGVYSPLVSEAEYLASQSRRFVDKLCRGSITAFAAALAGSGISDEDLEELRRLLEEKKQ